MNPEETPMTDAASAPDVADFPDVQALRYEQAREELVAIVGRLEAGQAPLEDSMQLWRRGEALAAHCAAWLDGAQSEIEEATRPRQDPPAPADRTDRADAATPTHADDAVFDEDA